MPRRRRTRERASHRFEARDGGSPGHVGQSHVTTGSSVVVCSSQLVAGITGSHGDCGLS
jgi:hypothetical protein